MSWPDNRELQDRRLGDFELVREIGRGGMGVVYEARQVSLNRKVALKVLSGSLGLTPKAVQRFHREAEAAARLHHTNIVPVYATAEQDGTHFYAMELIEGPSLDQVIRQLRQAHDGPPGEPTSTGDFVPGSATTGPYVEGAGAAASEAPSLTSSAFSSDSHYFDTVARMVAAVADALDYAHKNGVIHRDIKPSNLLLSPDERLSINDFGLARIVEQPGLTMTGEFVGTPAYMSPEQVTAGRTPLDHRTDIYSLGATLYELLTLQPPFTGERRDQVLAQIIHKEPKPPRRVNRKVPVDLETICLKSLDKDPDRRYQTASDMAEDLRRYVNRFAIAARRAGPVERLKKWVRRHPALAGTLACLLLALGTSGFFAYQSWRQERDRIAVEWAARQRLRDDTMQRAGEQVLQGDFAAAERAIQEALELGAAPEWADWRRGQIAYHRGEVEKAIELLEGAVPKLTGSAAPQTLLASAYVWAGLWGKHLQLREEMDSLTPVTAEDFLYLGLAQSYGNPTQGLQTLDRAIEQQPTLMAYVLRAQVRADHAMNTSDLRFAEEAIKDAEAAKTILRGNPSALCISVWVHQIAAGLCAPEEAAKREPILARARKDADDLARFPDLLQAVLVRGWFLEWDGRDEEALRIWERAVQQPEVGQQIAYLYAQGLYRRGEVEKALEFTKTRLPKGGHVLPYARAQFLAEFPDRHAEAIAIFNEILLILPAWQRPPEYAQLLLLLGRKDEAIAKMREGQPQLNHAPRHVRDVWANIGAFLSEPGPQAEQTFLRAAGRSRRDQAGAHFLVGLVRLADGDRRGAREQFEAAVATHCFYYDSYTWSRAYLSRMKQDPNWPAWIPPKN